MYLTPNLQILTDIALIAGKKLRQAYFKSDIKSLAIEMKGDADFVTYFDKKIEEDIVKYLSEKRPDYGFLTEENKAVKGSDSSNRFIIDPIDGTTNFIKKIPFFCISIAIERDRKPFCGVVYNPISDELFYAEKGFGAYLNKQRIRVSNEKKFSNSVFATGLPFKGRENNNMEKTFAIAKDSAGIRRMGSAALDISFVAAGRFDGFWEYNLSPWDIAAASIILTEAGGMISIFPDDHTEEQRPHLNGSIICANGFLFEELSGKLSK